MTLKNYSSCTKNENSYTVSCVLVRELNDYLKKEDFFSALETIYYMDEVIHTFLESREKTDATTFIASRDKRRKIRERSRKIA